MDRVVNLKGAAWLATGKHWLPSASCVPNLIENFSGSSGHYAGVEWIRGAPPFATKSGDERDIKHELRPRLVRSSDKTKDQTYYLSGVGEAALRKVRSIIFPPRSQWHSPLSGLIPITKYQEDRGQRAR